MGSEMSGRVVVMGSGELAPGLVATHRAGLQAAGAASVTLIDTPFGFQENADELTERITEFFATSLSVGTEVASVRSTTVAGATKARALAAIEGSRYVFAGPGSPTYALRVWQDLDLGPRLGEALAGGGTVCFASAAALTLGSHTLPVYEIYKVGEEPQWVDGLDVLGPVGLSVPIIPHWDNAEGGTHDTSHCYVGLNRFLVLMAELETGAIGIDEHTAATFDLAADTLTVTGRGGVTLWTPDAELVLGAGEEMALDEVVSFVGGAARVAEADPRIDESAADLGAALEEGDADAVLDALLSGGSPAERDLVRLADLASEGAVDPRDRVAGFVEVLLVERSAARDDGRWDAADRVRDALASLGVEVRDTPSGPEWQLRASTRAVTSKEDRPARQ